MRLINIDQAWTRIVVWGCRLTGRPRLAGDRRRDTVAALPVKRSDTADRPSTGTGTEG